MYPVAPSDPNRVIVFDTTLRDGEQAPGFSMGVKDKLMIAHALQGLRVDVIEAGFAAASPGDEEAVRVIASEIEGPSVCSLGRCVEGDIEAAARALEPARTKRMHVFLATSPIHRAAKLKMSREQVLAAADRAVRFARSIFEDVEFSAEDAIRTEPEFLVEVARAAAEAGASTINLPDTVGYSTPGEIGRIFRILRKRLSDFPEVRLSAHCHDDLGMAVANSLAAVEAGARQVEGAINGIGERAGNCAIEEFVMALRTRADVMPYDTGVDATQIMRTSRMVSEVTSSPVSRNKAVVGRNAFAHESGIHQHGVLNDVRTYEIMRPEDVGAEASELVLGKHSGRHAVSDRASKLGFVLDDASLSAVFADFKRRADEIGEVTEKELVMMIRRRSAPVRRRRGEDRLEAAQ